MRRKCLVICLLLLAVLALSLQSPTPPDESYGGLRRFDAASERRPDVQLDSAIEDESDGPLPEGMARRIARSANESRGAAIKGTPLRAFLIPDDEELSVEEDSDESFTIPTTTTHRTTTTTTRRTPLPNPEATQCVNMCKISIDRSRTKEKVSCKHFLAFRDCLTKRCRPTDRGYSMVLREIKLAINEEICHDRDIDFSARRIAQCDAATLKMEKELGREWAKCNDRYTNATSIPELCLTIKYCYLKIPLRYPYECQYAHRFLKYFVLAEFTETSNGLLAKKCPQIFPTADVDAYLPNQPYG